MSDTKPVEEPLPIWLFVGVILLTYGLLIMGAALFMEPRATVLAETKPGLWWGAVLVAAGGLFTGIGLKVHADNRKAQDA